MDKLRIDDKRGNYCAAEKKIRALDRETTTVLTPVDVTTGMTINCTVPKKGPQLRHTPDLLNKTPSDHYYEM